MYLFNLAVYTIKLKVTVLGRRGVNKSVAKATENYSLTINFNKLEMRPQQTREKHADQQGELENKPETTQPTTRTCIEPN